MKTFLTFICNTCHKEFQRPKGNTSNNRKYINHYCSNKCKYQSQFRLIEKVCKTCGKEFRKKPSQIKKTKFSFCSSSCSAIYWNKHKTTGTRRSKIEHYIESNLKKLYPNETIIFNDQKILELEMDIYFPRLELAFELNGIFHYEPIFGNERFQKIISHDKQKFKLCREKNISLCVIDISSQKHFTEKSSQRFLDIITEIVKEKNEAEEARTPNYTIDSRMH